MLPIDISFFSVRTENNFEKVKLFYVLTIKNTTFLPLSGKTVKELKAMKDNNLYWRRVSSIFAFWKDIQGLI